jgi:prepilin-type N-terminal cleavage/methylation domain-containing protein
MRRAFSLIELSIVLVILGLLTGGILAGQSLIRAAELRSIAADISRYNTAYRTFQDKYFGVPGDLRNATKFWGFANGTVGNDAACYDASQTGPGTCDGNGDGYWIATSVSSNNPNVENFHAWKQMANAGLIEGTYTGYRGPNSNYNTTPGTNVPRSRISNAGFSFWTTLAGSDANWYPQKTGNLIMFGTSTSGITEAPAIKPEEAWNIDMKMDDGKPGLGNTRTHKMGSGFTPNCTDGTDPNTSGYALNNSAIACNSYTYLF